MSQTASDPQYVIENHAATNRRIATDATPVPLAPLVSASTALTLGQRQVRRDAVSAAPLLVSDFAAVAIALLTGRLVESLLVGSDLMIVSPFGLIMAATTLFFQAFHGLYPGCGISNATEFGRCLRTVAATMLVGAVALTMKSPPLLLWVAFAGFISVLGLLLCVGRPVVRKYLGRTQWWPQPALIVGECHKSHELFQRMESCRHEGVRPLGLVMTGRQYWQKDPECQDRVIGPLSDLDAILLEHGVCRLAVASRYDSTTLDYQRYRGIPHVMMPTGLEYHPVERARLVDDGNGLHLHCQSALTNPASLMWKRALDLALIIGSAPFWLPVMVAIAAWIKITDPGPIFYPQKRVGRFGRPFNALKFRSMVVDADAKLQAYLADHPELRKEWDATHKLKNDPRVTLVGRFLRKTSLDELPQLFNVLRGEMSLVGPRPIIDCDQYDREYIEEHPEVFEFYQMVRPGITGLWQISGRNLTTYKQRVYMDRLYLQNWTISFDLFILWRTLKTAILREGAY